MALTSSVWRFPSGLEKLSQRTVKTHKMYCLRNITTESITTLGLKAPPGMSFGTLSFRENLRNILVMRLCQRTSNSTSKSLIMLQTLRAVEVITTKILKIIMGLS